MEIRLKLATLHAAQQRALDQANRFNVVAMGEKGGKTALAIEVLLLGPKGALTGRGHNVAYFAATADDLVAAKRRFLASMGTAFGRKVNSRRIEFFNGRSIDFYAMDDKRLESFDQYGTVVLDSAAKVPNLLDIWQDVVLPSLQRFDGQAWVLSCAFGKKNGFYELFKRERMDPDWISHQFPSFCNPHLDDEDRAGFEQLTGPEFEQRVESEFLDVAFVLTAGQRVILADETFRVWCERLATDGLKVDGHPFKLDDRPAMAWLYDQIPSTKEEAFNYVLVLMKCAQVGFTVMEMLAVIYLGLRFGPATVGMFLPDINLADIKSSKRFMPVVRSVKPVHDLMTMDALDGSGRKAGEGNVRTRNIGDAMFVFSWTSGKASTESIPMDILSFDEVQEMTLEQMEKARERLSASSVRFTLMGSTANWPDADIHAWYKKGSQFRFHTECPHCLARKPLDDYFPQCIQHDPEQRRYRYVCHSCNGWIDDPQRGEWLPDAIEVESDGEVRVRSVHFPQFLSPTISPGEILEAYNTASSLKNFYNRKLGKPYSDPSQIPINLEIMNACAALGMKLGLQWKLHARGTFMGLDQMGSFIVAVVKERMPDGRQAVVHLEYIFIAPTKEDPDASPWRRCDELMRDYGVQVCVVETLPNYDSAKSFARRHHGKVFLAGYGNMEGDMLVWGDTPALNASERRTDEDARDRYTVRLDQFKCMQVSMSRFIKQLCLFPNPDELVQEVLEKGVRKQSVVCREQAFMHFTKTALVVEKDDEEKKYKRRVVKVGIDPHTSYANMLCDVAWARAHGTTTFLLPQEVEEKPISIVRGGGSAVMTNMPTPLAQIANQQQLTGSVCGRCMSFDPDRKKCRETGYLVRPQDPGCYIFVAKPDEA